MHLYFMNVNRLNGMNTTQSFIHVEVNNYLLYLTKHHELKIRGGLVESHMQVKGYLPECSVSPTQHLYKRLTVMRVVNGDVSSSHECVHRKQHRD